MNKSLIALFVSAALTGCASTSNEPGEANATANDTNVYTVKPSYLNGQGNGNSQFSTSVEVDLSSEGSNSTATKKQGTQRLTSPYKNKSISNFEEQSLKHFSVEPSLQVTTENMPLSTFAHYVFGELLNVSYVVSDQIANPDKKITLNLQQAISPRKLYELTEDYLIEAGNQVTFKDNIFYITPSEKGSLGRSLGVGNKVSDVPSGRLVTQIVPIQYQLSSASLRAISSFSSANITNDSSQSALYLDGNYEEVVRAVEMINLLDNAAYRSQNIALVNLTYTPAEEFIQQVQSLLKNEGINASLERAESGTVFVPMERIGAVAVFSTSRTTIQRVEYWAKIIDVPVQGAKLNYFLYYPEFARASDLAQSLMPLLSNQSSTTISRSSNDGEASTNAGEESKQTSTKQRETSIVKNSKNLVVDERSNALIFNMSATDYNQILPLVKQLDTLPKQILLDVTIAEVTLTNEFKQGVEFYLEKGNSSFSTKGALGLKNVGGLGYVLDTGNLEILANLSAGNSNVNVLSNPSILVRDGVSASINVGTDIPVVTSTVDNSGDSSQVTKTVQYRKTGVNVSVTPTVNSRGVVIMTIEQNISNTVATSADAESPSIFDRSLSTEVVADNSQTIVLGGLISENTTVSETKVPFLGDIPMLGNLFKYKSDDKTKTELVMLITPRIIQRSDEWQEIKHKFQSGFEVLNFHTTSEK